MPQGLPSLYRDAELEMNFLSSADGSETEPPTAQQSIKCRKYGGVGYGVPIFVLMAFAMVATNVYLLVRVDRTDTQLHQTDTQLHQTQVQLHQTQAQLQSTLAANNTELRARISQVSDAVRETEEWMHTTNAKLEVNVTQARDQALKAQEIKIRTEFDQTIEDLRETQDQINVSLHADMDAIRNRVASLEVSPKHQPEYGLPMFSVRTGPCTTTAGGACFRSSGYPNLGYGLKEKCEITVNGSGFVKATTFNTVRGYDWLIIGGHFFSGDGGDLPRTGYTVTDGEIIAWSATGKDVNRGFEVCGVSNLTQPDNQPKLPCCGTTTNQ